jgi:hypothetical protein
MWQSALLPTEVLQTVAARINDHCKFCEMWQSALQPTAVLLTVAVFINAYCSFADSGSLHYCRM